MQKQIKNFSKVEDGENKIFFSFTFIIVVRDDDLKSCLFRRHANGELPEWTQSRMSTYIVTELLYTYAW